MTARSSRGASVWRALIAIKSRQRRRIDSEAAAARQALTQARALAGEREQAAEQAGQRLHRHRLVIDELMGADALSVRAYLQHEAFAEQLERDLAQARQAAMVAATAVAEREAELDILLRALARLDAMLEQCHKTAQRLEADEASRRELAAEEEAVEALLARARPGRQAGRRP